MKNRQQPEGRARSAAHMTLAIMLIAGAAHAAPAWHANASERSQGTATDARVQHTPFGAETIVRELQLAPNLVAPADLGTPHDATGLSQQLASDRMLDALYGRIDTSALVDYKGQRLDAQTVRYIEDFEDGSVQRPEWSDLRAREYEGTGRVAGPFRAQSASLRVETKVDELYVLRFDLELLAARLGSQSASDTFIVELDGEPISETPLHEFTAIAMAQRTSFDDPLSVPKIQLFFRAGYRISTITFRSEDNGGGNGEVWGLDDILIDRVTMNPAEIAEKGFTLAGVGGGGGGGGGSASRLPTGGGGGGASSGGRGGGDGNGSNPQDVRLPDLIPPDDTTTPAPDLPPPTPIDPPTHRPPGDPEDPPPPPPPPADPPPPEVPAPGGALVFGVGALTMGRRRRREG